MSAGALARDDVLQFGDDPVREAVESPLRVEVGLVDRMGEDGVVEGIDAALHG